MEVLFEHEITNVEGQKIKVLFFKRDARSPKEIENNDPIRYEHVRSLEFFDNDVWNKVSEEIIEYLIVNTN